MDKKKAIETIDEVVISAREKFDNFAGFIIHGSFASGEPEPRDIDLMPVYYIIPSDEKVQSASRKYISEAFPKLPEGEYIKNRFGFLQDSIYHVTDSVFLEDANLKYLLAARRVRNSSFRGDYDAKKRIDEILSEKK
jgi:predicted nucleotidyltransferase